MPSWVSIPGPGQALPDLSRYPGGAGSRTPCPGIRLHPETRPSRTPAFQVRLYQISHAILEGRAPARPVPAWSPSQDQAVTEAGPPGQALPDPSRYPGGAGSRTHCPAMVFIPGPGRHGGRPSRSGSTRSLTLSWRGGLPHALSRHQAPSRDQAVEDAGLPGPALPDLSRYPGGAGSRTPCHAMGLHPRTRPSRRPALQVRLYQISHAILEGWAPARPVPASGSIPRPGRRGRRPSRSGSTRSLTLSWRGGLPHALSRHGLHPRTRPSRRPALQGPIAP